jgi:hypothetical protein
MLGAPGPAACTQHSKSAARRLPLLTLTAVRAELLLVGYCPQGLLQNHHCIACSTQISYGTRQATGAVLLPLRYHGSREGGEPET